MSVLAVSEPHAVHAFSRQLEITDLARFSGISNVIDADAGFVGNIGGKISIEIRTLLILNQNIAGDLHLVGMRIGWMRHLAHHFWIRRISRIHDAERHRRSSEMSNVDVATILEQLHAVAMTVQIMMAD